MSTLPLNYRVLSATILMIGILRIQRKFEPYKTESNNRLEFNEIITGTFTIYATMIYQDEENNQPAIDFIVFWLGKFLVNLKQMYIVILVNLRFLLLWLHYMLGAQKYSFMKKISKIIGIIVLIKINFKEVKNIKVSFHIFNRTTSKLINYDNISYQRSQFSNLLKFIHNAQTND